MISQTTIYKVRLVGARIKRREMVVGPRGLELRNRENFSTEKICQVSLGEGNRMGLIKKIISSTCSNVGTGEMGNG